MVILLCLIKKTFTAHSQFPVKYITCFSLGSASKICFCLNQLQKFCRVLWNMDNLKDIHFYRNYVNLPLFGCGELVSLGGMKIGSASSMDYLLSELSLVNYSIFEISRLLFLKFYLQFHFLKMSSFASYTIDWYFCFFVFNYISSRFPYLQNNYSLDYSTLFYCSIYCFFLHTYNIISLNFPRLTNLKLATPGLFFNVFYR